MRILSIIVYETVRDVNKMAAASSSTTDYVNLNLSGYYYLVHSKFVELPEMYCLSVEYQEL